jgi:hypothetical protein
MAQQQYNSSNYHDLGLSPSASSLKLYQRHRQLLAIFDPDSCNAQPLKNLSASITARTDQAYSQIVSERQASESAKKEIRKVVFFEWTRNWAVIMFVLYFLTQPSLRALKIQRDAEAASDSGYGIHQWYSHDIIGDLFMQAGQFISRLLRLDEIQDAVNKFMWQQDWAIYALVFCMGAMLLWEAIVTPEQFFKPFKDFFGIKSDD